MSDEIEAFIRSQALVGRKEKGIGSIGTELESSEGFARKLPGVEDKFSACRRIRGDGNCFYRGFTFRYLEILRENEVERKRVLEIVKGSLEYLTQVGYEAVSIETFCEYAQETIEGLETKSLESIEELFGNEGESDYLVWFSRLISAGYLKHNAERFFPFLPQNFGSVEEFCSMEVEPMGKECEQLQVIALSEYLQVGVRVVYLDNSDSDEAAIHTFGPDSPACTVDLLYRPSHYDLLYP